MNLAQLIAACICSTVPYRTELQEAWTSHTPWSVSCQYTDAGPIGTYTDPSGGCTEPTSTQLLCNETGPFPDSPPLSEYCAWHTATERDGSRLTTPSSQIQNTSTNKMLSLYSLPLFCKLLGLHLLVLLSFGARWDLNVGEPHCSVNMSVCGPPGFLILHY